MTQRCAKADNVIEVHSDSNYDKTYKVTFAHDALPTCTCVSFAIGRNRMKSRKPTKPGNQDAFCKHIERVWHLWCTWEGEPLIPGFSICPQCGGPSLMVEKGGVNA